MIDFYYTNHNKYFYGGKNGIPKCKWGCGREVKFKDWCSRFPSQCPSINIKCGKKISETKKLLGKFGLNPMQNPEICKKNHSPERNKKSSETLKGLGQLGLLPQQIEPKQLKEKRKRNVSKKLRKLSKEGKLWFQRSENWQKVKKRNKKISQTIKKLWKEKKILTPKLDDSKKLEIKRKMSKIMRKRVKLGFRPPKVKKIPHIRDGNLIFLRSEFEKRVIKLLDKFSLNWQFEPFLIQFWNSKQRRHVFTIPDFFIPEFMTLIEVKGEEGQNLWLTKDKVKGMKSFGFNVLVFGKKDIERMENGEINILKKLQEVSNNA